ncbi:MAG: hypothetical protein ACI875_001911, partial [Planctomycetota bacterium]
PKTFRGSIGSENFFGPRLGLNLYSPRRLLRLVVWRT